MEIYDNDDDDDSNGNTVPCPYPQRICNYAQIDSTSVEYLEAEEMPHNGQGNHSIKNL